MANRQGQFAHAMVDDGLRVDRDGWGVADDGLPASWLDEEVNVGARQSEKGPASTWSSLALAMSMMASALALAPALAGPKMPHRQGHFAHARVAEV